MNHREQLLKRDEMHPLSILIHKTSLQIKINNQLSGKIQTTTSITQKDCLNAILFIFYLSSCLNNQKQTNNIQPNNNNTQHFFIEPKYADGIVWITTSKHEVERVKANILRYFWVFSSFQTSKMRPSKLEVLLGFSASSESVISLLNLAVLISGLSGRMSPKTLVGNWSTPARFKPDSFWPKKCYDPLWTVTSIGCLKLGQKPKAKPVLLCTKTF